MVSKKELKNALLHEGAVLVGVAKAEPIPEIAEWIDERSHAEALGEMKWLSDTSKKRSDPTLHLKGVASVIVTAWPYDLSSKVPGIARFAQGSDYHKRIRNGMIRAWRKLFDKTENVRFLVDSKPLAEKIFAARSGIGWIGKNSLLIHPDKGSFFCLGIILSDQKWEPDSPIESQCGECERCVKGCPTEAIRSPFQIDCGRCISYLTIEHVREIPDEFRRMVGGNVYGCDVCQEVCPFNQQNTPSEVSLDQLHAWLEMNKEEFDRFFKDSTLHRIGHNRFLRNVAVAIGNIGEKSSLPFLSGRLQKSDNLVRMHIEWAIKKINNR